MRRLAGLLILGITALAAASPPAAVSIDARALAPGELLVVNITADTALVRVDLSAFDRTIAGVEVSPRKWQALVGVDLDVKPGPYVMVVRGTPADATAAWSMDHPVLVSAKTFRTRRLTVDEAFVNPPRAVETRIIDEARQLEAIWKDSAPARLWDGAFVRPVPQAATSAFGTRSVFNGEPRSAHGGADFASPAGTPILAPNGGRVVLARDLYFTGNTVVIDHGLGLVSLFAHLSAISVAEGERVARGQPLGRVGATGRATGPHLHWALRANGARIDPVSLLTLLGQDGR